MVSFPPCFLFCYNPHFCYPPFHPVFLRLLVRSYCSLSLVFMQKPKSIRSNKEPQRQPHQDSSIHIFSSGCTDCLRELRQVYESGTLLALCVASVAVQVFRRDQTEVPLKESFTFMPQESLHPCECNWSIPVPRFPGLPEQAWLFRPKGDTQALRYILLLMKLLCLFYCLGE